MDSLNCPSDLILLGCLKTTLIGWCHPLKMVTVLDTLRLDTTIKWSELFKCYVVMGTLLHVAGCSELP